MRFSSKIYFDSDVEIKLEEKDIQQCLFVKSNVDTKIKQIQSDNMCVILQRVMVYTELMEISTLGSCFSKLCKKERTLQHQ